MTKNSILLNCLLSLFIFIHNNYKSLSLGEDVDKSVLAKGFRMELNIQRIAIENLSVQAEFGFSFRHRNTILDIANHIESVGLLNPLVITETLGGYSVLNGRLRFYAIKRLIAEKRLPRSLNHIPCIMRACGDKDTVFFDKPFLLSDNELAHIVLDSYRQGMDLDDLSDVYLCSPAIIDQIISLKHLHPKLMFYFSKGMISLEQAVAFATISNKNAQYQLFLKLGPFVEEREIIAAITNGATVIELLSGETLILPSRELNPVVTHYHEHVTYKIAA